MESSRFFRMFEISLKFSNYFGSSPFLCRRDGKRTYFHLVVNSRLVQRCAIVLVMLGGHTLFFLVQSYFSYKAGNLGGFCFSMFFLAMGLNLTYSLSISVLEPDEYAAMVNTQNDYFNKFQSKWIPGYSPRTSKLNRVADSITFLTCISCAVTQLLCFAHFFVFPNTGIYLTSIRETVIHGVILSETHPVFSTVIFGLGVIFYFHFFGAIYSLILVYILATKTYITFIYQIVGLRSPSTLPIEYRTLELVHGLTVALYGPIIPITESLCGYIITIASYMIIRHGRDLDNTAFGIVTMWSTGMFVLFISILRFGGLFFSKSKMTLSSWAYWKDGRGSEWKSELQIKYIKKFQQSCRPLALEFPGYYRINNFSVLKFVQGIIRGTVRVLLAFK